MTATGTAAGDDFLHPLKARPPDDVAERADGDLHPVGVRPKTSTPAATCAWKISIGR
ncbi:MAG TPA: hypothetical protein VJ774_00655 [Actinomycetota bacterium]|nr:hypothetical protein [Actinomycetota bacterium]